VENFVSPEIGTSGRMPQSLRFFFWRRVEWGPQERSEPRQERWYIEAQKSHDRPQQQAQVLTGGSQNRMH